MDVSLAGNGRWEGGGHVFPNPETLSGVSSLYSVCRSMCGLVTMCRCAGDGTQSTRALRTWMPPSWCPFRCPTSTCGLELPIRFTMDWALVEGGIGNDLAPLGVGVGRAYKQNTHTHIHTCEHMCKRALSCVYTGLKTVPRKSQASLRRSGGSIRSWQGCSG